MNDDTLLHRQINPSWIQAERVTRQAFKPTRKDNKCLSVYNGDLITAEDAWKYYTETLGLLSVGVLAVSCDDCAVQRLPVRSDPASHPAHAVIDFTACSEKEADRKAKQLKTAAVERGWQYKTDVAS